MVFSAIASGINVLDTARHFHAGSHERAVGQGIVTAIDAGLCSREDLLVCSTIGPVPELITRNVQQLGFGRVKAFVEERFISRGLFDWHDLSASRYTLAPRYLREVTERSLHDLGLTQVDCLFVDALAVHARAVSTAELRRRLQAAFAEIAALHQEGTIRSWGIASSEALDLEPIISAATEVGAHESLRGLRVPFSLLQPRLRAMIDAAAERGWYVLATGVLDGGAPQYQLPDELDVALGMHSDPAAAIQWVQSAPGITTAVFGTRDQRHLRANVAAACLPELAANHYDFEEQVEQ